MIGPKGLSALSLQYCKYVLFGTYLLCWAQLVDVESHITVKPTFLLNHMSFPMEWLSLCPIND